MTVWLLFYHWKHEIWSYFNETSRQWCSKLTGSGGRMSPIYKSEPLLILLWCHFMTKWQIQGNTFIKIIKLDEICEILTYWWSLWQQYQPRYRSINLHDSNILKLPPFQKWLLLPVMWPLLPVTKSINRLLFQLRVSFRLGVLHWSQKNQKKDFGKSHLKIWHHFSGFEKSSQNLRSPWNHISRL